MPRELKIDREYHAALRRIGVKDPGEVGVGVPPQLTVPVDDLTHLTPPIEVPVEGFGRVEPAQAVRFAVAVQCAVRGGPNCRGVWLLFAGTATNDIVLLSRNASIITDDESVLLPGFNTSPVVADSPLIWSRGTTTISPVLDPNRGIILQAGGEWTIPMFFPPGSFICLVGQITNSPATGSMVVQIVPGV